MRGSPGLNGGGDTAAAPMGTQIAWQPFTVQQNTGNEFSIMTNKHLYIIYNVIQKHKYYSVQDNGQTI